MADCGESVALEHALVYVSLYLFAVRMGGVLCERIKMSPIVGEIIVGAILGPTCLGWVPYSDGLMLVGILGVQLAVIEAGLATDMAALKTLGPRGLFIAVLGIILPITLAVVVVMAWGGKFLEAFAIGAAIAPTSLGVVAKLLKEKNELATPLGQVISMAAVFDDVLSLILLSFIQKLANASATSWDLASPIVFAFIFIVGALVASGLVPKAVVPLMAKVTSEKQGFFALFNLLAFALLLTFLANLAKTSFLLGGYLAGIAFASVGDVVPDVYEKQVKRIMLWTARLFFAATIGFAIPVREMFTGSAIGLGLVLGAIAVFGKVLCGVGTYPLLLQNGPAVGVAMLGRGEFGFLIAKEAYNLKLVNQSQYASAVWGVVIPTILTPILFGPVFDWRRSRMEAKGVYKAASQQNDVEQPKGNAKTDEAEKGIGEEAAALRREATS